METREDLALGLIERSPPILLPRLLVSRQQDMTVNTIKSRKLNNSRMKDSKIRRNFHEFGIEFVSFLSQTEKMTAMGGNKSPEGSKTRAKPKNGLDSSFLSLYKFSHLQDKFCLILGWTLAIAAGMAIPMLNVNFGKIIDVYVTFDRSHRFHAVSTHFAPNGSLHLDFDNSTEITISNVTKESTYGFKQPSFHSRGTVPNEVIEFNSKSYAIAFNTLALGFGYFFVCYFFVACLSSTAMKQVYRIKLRFYESLLRQEISWFDSEAAGGFAGRMTGQFKLIEDGMGEKTGFFLYMLSTSVSSLLVAVYYGWELTIVLLALTPAHAIVSSIISKLYSKYAKKESESCRESSIIEREVISMIKTVFAFGTERNEQERYDKSIERTMKWGILCQMSLSMALSLIWLTNYLMYAIGIWYGTKLIIASRETGSDDYTPGKMIIVFWNVISISYYSGRVGPYLEAFEAGETHFY